jgi:hypothetical protein
MAYNFMVFISAKDPSDIMGQTRYFATIAKKKSFMEIHKISNKGFLLSERYVQED